MNVFKLDEPGSSITILAPASDFHYMKKKQKRNKTKTPTKTSTIIYYIENLN